MFILGMFLGTVVGMLLISVISMDRISEYEEDLHTQIMLRRNRDKFIKKQMEINLAQKNKITDLENNIEFLVNNLSAQKKKLVRPENQD